MKTHNFARAGFGLALLIAFQMIIPAPDLASGQTQAPRLRLSPSPSVPTPLPQVVGSSSPANGPLPLVLILGWSCVPEEIINSLIIQSLARDLYVAGSDGNSIIGPTHPGAGGDRTIFVCRHKDPYIDINENAKFEAGEIVRFMDKMRTEHGNRFDLVGHSMGGLVSRSIIESHPGILGQYKIRRFTVLGTPNHGANPALSTLEFDDPRGGALPGANAGSQMNPLSPFLNDLNQKTIPEDIEVVTIAGNIQVDAAPHPQHANGDPPPNMPCRHIISEHSNDGQVWDPIARKNRDIPCVHKVPQHPNGDPNPGPRIPCTHMKSGRMEICNDGFIRVNSVQFSPQEARRIVRQEVLVGMYHSSFTQQQLRPLVGASLPILMVGCDIPPNNPGIPVPGRVVAGTDFFSDPRVTELLRK